MFSSFIHMDIPWIKPCRVICRLTRPEKVKQVKAKSTAETILKRTFLTVIPCQQVEKTFWMKALHQEEEGRG